MQFRAAQFDDITFIKLIGDDEECYPLTAAECNIRGDDYPATRPQSVHPLQSGYDKIARKVERALEEPVPHVRDRRRDRDSDRR